MSDETRPEGLETKDLPRGYGHAGVPAPDVTGVMSYSESTDTVQPVTPVNAPAGSDSPATEPEADADPNTEGSGTANAGAHEADAPPDATNAASSDQ
jgi:hypothetical protein